MKQIISILLFSNLSFAQETTEPKRFSNEIQLKTYTTLIFPAGYEIDYQANFNLSDKITIGGRIGFFYNQRENFRYKMIPIYITSEIPIGKRKKSAFCVDLGTSLLLNQDSQRINNMANFWVSNTSYDDHNFYYRKRILLIVQSGFKFNFNNNFGVSLGLNSYLANVSGGKGKQNSPFCTVGLQVGVLYKFLSKKSY